MNPYSTPVIEPAFVSQGEFLTETGVLSALLIKHPGLFWLSATILLIGGLGGLAVFVGHP